MKKDISKAAGFLRNTLNRVSGKPEPAFYPLDAIIMTALMVGSVVAMRFLVGH